MQLEYLELEDDPYSFVILYWGWQTAGDRLITNEVNDWNLAQFGEHHQSWMFTRGHAVLHHGETQWYAWRFAKKSDAVLFKLRWHEV